MLHKFNVMNRFSGDLQFTATIDCDEDALPRIKLGLAVKWAYNSGAVLSGAVLSGAVLSGADLRGADLRGADLSLIGIPVIPALDSKILAAIESGGGKLNMNKWHTCKTTHCRAGWAITIAGDAGAELEKKIGPAGAGALTYAASYPGQRIPNFYASDDDALADIKARAATDVVSHHDFDLNEFDESDVE
jgi:Pentapeptide repeats (8 copies)